MPTYVFKGRNRMNEIVAGERVADDREALQQILRREQVTLTSVKEKGREIGIPKLVGRRKVNSKDLAIFTRQFSVMIDAGLPLVQCLDILAQQQQNKYFQQVLAQVRQDVEEGSTLAAAFNVYREGREIKTGRDVGDDLSGRGNPARDHRCRGDHDRRYPTVPVDLSWAAWTRRTPSPANAHRGWNQQLFGGLGRLVHVGGHHWHRSGDTLLPQDSKGTKTN